MKILIVDTLFPIGHQLLNAKLISLISTKMDIIAFNYNNYYNEKLRVNFIQIKFLFKPPKNIYLNIIAQILNAIIIGFKSIFIKYDRVILFTFDTITFPVLSIFLHKPGYLFHHNNTDHLQNKWKYKIFKLYKNKVNHIVFADFIKEYLIMKEVPENRIFTLPHPLVNSFFCEKDNVNIPKSKNKDEFKYYIGLGYANDKVLITKIVDYENKNQILKKNNIYLLLRSEIEVYETKNIIIIKGYLQKEVYDSYFEKADGILTLYSNHYKNRFSGVVMDAFCHAKQVIGPNIPIIRYFNQLYPQNCKYFVTIAELFEYLQNSNTNFSSDEYIRFLENHSNKKIADIFYKIFK
jgi:hypothetical protein